MNLIYNPEKFDSSLNFYREIFSNTNNIPTTNGNEQQYESSILIPLDFSLEMDGISGIIPNSAFEVPSNVLPTSYLTKNKESKIAFILHTVDHNFNNNKWTTKITGQTLLIRFDPLSPEEIERRKKAKEIIKKKKKSEGYSSGRGGTTRNINIPVVKYLIEQKQQNGKLNNSYLRNLNIPDDPASNRIHKLFPAAATQWEKLISEARKAGFKVKQTNISYVNGAAYRGPTSNNSVHGWGCAIDIQSLVTAQGGQNSFNDITAAKKVRDTNTFYIWLNNNAKNYGWINPSWAKDGKGMEEAWHWEYHGPVNI
jgi:hypothetical protein